MDKKFVNCGRCSRVVEYVYKPPTWCKGCKQIAQRANRRKKIFEYNLRSEECKKAADKTIDPKWLVRGL